MNKMKNYALIITILGLFILLIILLTSKPIKINNLKDLEKLQANQKILISGKVTDEKTYGKTKYLTISNFQVICNSCPSYLNKNLSILGIKEDYTGKTRIVALKITLINYP